jgi:hypothetical protein
MHSEEECREVVALLAPLKTPTCLFGQLVEWSYGHFDDRSGSGKLTQQR